MEKCQCDVTGSSGMLEQLGIGITTKDRWDDLEATLTVLSCKGFSALETIVIDDGSLCPAPPALLSASHGLDLNELIDLMV